MYEITRLVVIFLAGLALTIATLFVIDKIVFNKIMREVRRR